MSGFESIDNLVTINNNKIDSFFEELEPIQNEVFDFDFQKPTADTAAYDGVPSLQQIPSNASQMRRLSLTIDEFIFDTNNNERSDSYGAPLQLPTEEKEHSFIQGTSEPQQEEKALLEPIPYTSIDPFSQPVASSTISNDFSAPCLNDFEQTFRTQLERLISCMNKSRQTRNQVARVKKLLKMQEANSTSKKNTNNLTKKNIHKRRRSSMKHSRTAIPDFCF
jgi:hypothetical protein